MAHGEMNVHLLGDNEEGQPIFEMLLTEPKYLERIRLGFGISAKDLDEADYAFRALSGDLELALDGRITGPSLEKRRELILQRPKLQHSKAIAPATAARKRRSQAREV